MGRCASPVRGSVSLTGCADKREHAHSRKSQVFILKIVRFRVLTKWQVFPRRLAMNHSCVHKLWLRSSLLPIIFVSMAGLAAAQQKPAKSAPAPSKPAPAAKPAAAPRPAARPAAPAARPATSAAARPGAAGSKPATTTAAKPGAAAGARPGTSAAAKPGAAGGSQAKSAAPQITTAADSKPGGAAGAKGGASTTAARQNERSGRAQNQVAQRAINQVVQQLRMRRRVLAPPEELPRSPRKVTPTTSTRAARKLASRPRAAPAPISIAAAVSAPFIPRAA